MRTGPPPDLEHGGGCDGTSRRIARTQAGFRGERDHRGAAVEASAGACVPGTARAGQVQESLLTVVTRLRSRRADCWSSRATGSAGRRPRMASSQCEDSDENHGPHLRSSRNLLSMLQGGCGPDAGAAGSLGAAVASLRAAAAEPVDARDCTSREDAGAPGACGQSRLIVRTNTGIARAGLPSP